MFFPFIRFIGTRTEMRCCIRARSPGRSRTGWVKQTGLHNILGFWRKCRSIYNFRIKMGAKIVFSLEIIRWHNDGYLIGGAIIKSMAVGRITIVVHRRGKARYFLPPVSNQLCTHFLPFVIFFSLFFSIFVQKRRNQTFAKWWRWNERLGRLLFGHSKL